jgi:hypothetical protein
MDEPSAWSLPGEDSWIKLQTVPLDPQAEPLGQAPINPCFAAGTRILTDIGEVKVEDLSPGDQAILAEGDIAEIIWIGRRDLDLARHPFPALVRPVRIAAGALAMGVPERELTLSPDHALYFDGSLVQAKDLIDGVVIVQDQEIPTIRYYHVELKSHGILLAEGAGAESYLDTGHRGVFSNATAPLILHPDLMQIRRQASSVAPLVTGGEELAAIRAQLHGRKLMLGYSVAEAPLLALKCAGALLPPSESSPGRVTFTPPEDTRDAILCCPVFVPAEVDPASNDRRRLGIALTEIMLDGKLVPLESVIAPADIHRRAPREVATWTRGAARLSLPKGTKTITLLIAASPRLWQDSRQSSVVSRQT